MIPGKTTKKDVSNSKHFLYKKSRM